MIWFRGKSASESNLAKPLYKNWDTLENIERLPGIVWDSWKTPAEFKQERMSSFIQKAESFDGYWNKDMRCRQTGILRNFSLSDRMRCTSRDLSAKDNIPWCQRVYYRGVAGQAAATLPWYQCKPVRTHIFPGSKPDGSLPDWVSAGRRARQTRSFIYGWRLELPLHKSQCRPLTSTVRPQWQEWGSHRFSPKQRPITILTASLLMQRPQAEVGKAKSHSLPWSAFTTSHLALLTSEVVLSTNVWRSRATTEASQALWEGWR